METTLRTLVAVDPFASTGWFGLSEQDGVPARFAGATEQLSATWPVKLFGVRVIVELAVEPRVVAATELAARVKGALTPREMAAVPVAVPSVAVTLTL